MLNELWIKGERVQESRLSRVKREVKEQLGLEIYNVSNKAISEYKNTTRRNKNLSFEDATLKLNRAYHSSRRINKENDDFCLKSYGNMQIVFDKKLNKITKAWNNDRGQVFVPKVDWELKKQLSEIMGLN